MAFKVTDSRGTAIGPGDGTFYTNAAGEIVIEGLEPGTTVIAREIKTVDGFVLDGTPKSVVIEAGKNAPELIFWNKRAGTLLDYADLVKKADGASTRYNDLSEKIKAAEKRMAEIAVMKTHIINYSKTRNVYVAYRKAGYSKKFKAEHESEILLHQAAKKFFDESGLNRF